MASVKIRFAEAADMAAVCDIVNHYIRTTSANFRTAPQTPDDWLSDWTKTYQRYPWLVATRDRAVVGIAYASQWNARAAYAWCVEVTVYVAHTAARQGVGRALYQRLLDVIDQQGFHTQIAVIGLPNDPSIALHEAFGFDPVGTFKDAGFKNDGWRDVGFWQRCGAPDDTAPSPIGTVPGLEA